MNSLLKQTIFISLVISLVYSLSGCTETPGTTTPPSEIKKGGEVVVSATGTIVEDTGWTVLPIPTIDCAKVTTFTGAMEYYKDSPTSKTGAIIDNYFIIKREFTDPEVLKKLAYEANVIKELATPNDCSGILTFNQGDTYTYDLCKIYKAKDLKQLETFSFDDGDESMKITLQSLIEGKYLSGAKATIYDAVTRYDTLKTKLTLDLTKDYFDGYAIPYYIYIQNNSSELFIKKLDETFIKECQQTLAK